MYSRPSSPLTVLFSTRVTDPTNTASAAAKDPQTDVVPPQLQAAARSGHRSTTANVNVSRVTFISYLQRLGQGYSGRSRFVPLAKQRLLALGIDSCFQRLILQIAANPAQRISDRVAHRSDSQPGSYRPVTIHKHK